MNRLLAAEASHLAHCFTLGATGHIMGGFEACATPASRRRCGALLGFSSLGRQNLFIKVARRDLQIELIGLHLRASWHKFLNFHH